MMSALKGGGGGRGKANEIGCVNFIVLTSYQLPSADKGEGVKKTKNVADVIHGNPLK